MALKVGDNVKMYANGELVAVGIVHSTDPNEYCHCYKIGPDNVSVLMDRCVKGDTLLPFPTMDATGIREAIGSVVRWDKRFLHIIDGGDIESIATSHEDCSDEFNEEILFSKDEAFDGPKGVSADPFSYRQAWKEKRVLLWDEGNRNCLGEGIIFYVLPFDAIQFDILGEECVGVGIEKMYDADSISLGTNVDSITLLKWPIDRVTTHDKKPLASLCNVQAGESKDNMDHALFSDIIPLSKKRRYHMVNRIQKQKSIHASNARLTIESVRLVSTIDCCNKKCCQLANRDVVLMLRREFWGQCLEDRINYVYNTLGTAQRRNPFGKVYYVFSFDGSDVCCRSWYEVHAMPKTSFYRYKEQFQNGAKKFMHGNVGIIGKARDHIEMGKAIIRDFVENNSERMPHKCITLADGSRETQLVIPEIYRQTDILYEVNLGLKKLGYKLMSSSSFNRIWNNEFKHVTLSKTSEFSKCSVCTGIKAQLSGTKIQEERDRLMEERRKHMLQQQSCRNLYYTWRRFSQMIPKKYLCIIHDKMDQKKTAIPRLEITPKDVDNAWQLQVSLNGMITHGHGHGHYGHFSLTGLWPSDPNATIGSLSVCLRNLEREDDHGLGDLSNDGKRECGNPLFDAICSRKALDLHRMTQCKVPLPGSSRESCMEQICLEETAGQPSCSHAESTLTSQTIIPRFRKLPENLLLQLDNCAGENKNRYMFAYLSLLVARGVFKTIQLGFLMVGHTHEDIDAMFSRFSEKLRKSMTYTFPHLMDVFGSCEIASPAPFLMTHVPDFKSFVDGYLCDGADALVGHSKPLQFRFFMSDNVPVMQYKVHPKQEAWLPKEGGIELWKRDGENKTMLPLGSPQLLPLADFVRDNTQVILGIKDYVRYWEKWITVKGLGYTRHITPVVEYWKKMITELEKPIVTTRTYLDEDFWPRSIGTHRMDVLDIEASDDEFEGYEEFNNHYCGPANKRPKEAFKPMIDVKKGDFILLRPSEPEKYPIWLAVASSNVDMDPSSNNYKKILIQYWAPVCQKSGLNDEEVYRACWEKTWMCNTRDPMVWESIDAVVWAWVRRGKKNSEKIKIPKLVQQKAKEGLKAIEF